MPTGNPCFVARSESSHVPRLVFLATQNALVMLGFASVPVFTFGAPRRPPLRLQARGRSR
eukprot:1492939-Prymnesium_polylepis.1